MPNIEEDFLPEYSEGDRVRASRSIRCGSLCVLKGSRGNITLVDSGRNIFGNVIRPVTYDILFEKDGVEVNGVPENYIERG